MDCNVGKLENARFTFALWLGFLWNSAKNIFHFSFPMLSTILVFMLMFSWPKRFYSIHWGNMSGRFYSFGVPYKLLGGERYSYQRVLPGQHEDSKLHLSESNLEKRQQHSKPPIMKSEFSLLHTRQFVQMLHHWRWQKEFMRRCRNETTCLHEHFWIQGLD